MEPRHPLTSTPTPRPLRIPNLPIRSEKSSTVVKKNSCSPSRIPRRPQTQDTYSFVSPLPSPRRPVKATKFLARRARSHSHKSDPSPHSKILQRAMECLSTNKDDGMEGESSPGYARQRQLTPKGAGIFTRAINALDFRSREPSGNETDQTSRMHGIRLPSLQKSTHQKGSESSLEKHSGIHTDETFCDNLYERTQSYKHQLPPFNNEPLQVAKMRGYIASPSRFPHRAPVTSAAVRLAVDAHRSNPGQGSSSWVSAVVTASIDDSVNESDISGKPGADVPLDVMIFVDNSSRISEMLLKAACKNAYQIASALDILIDRISICCISPNPTQKLNILMPLSSYSLDTVRILFRSLPAFQLSNGELSRSKSTALAIKEASSYLIRHSSRGALCHMFIVTAGSTILIPEDCDSVKLRYHTISPESAMVFDNHRSLEGWHLATTFDDEENEYVESNLKQALQQVIRHLRTGLDPGYLKNLSVHFDSGPDSNIEAILGETTRSILRLGESWTILVKIRPPCGPTNVSQAKSAIFIGENELHPACESTVDIMIDQLQGMLKPGVCSTDIEDSIVATLEYKHSAFPENACITSKERCKIERFQRRVTWDDNPRLPARSHSINGRPQCFETPYDSSTIKVTKRQHVLSHLSRNGYNQGNFGKENAAPMPATGVDHLACEYSPPLGSRNPYKDVVCSRDDFVWPQGHLGRPGYGILNHSEDPFVQT